MGIFLNQNFKKICSEPRGKGLDSLILPSVLDNRKKLRSLVDDGRHPWIEGMFDIKALMLALDELEKYYSGEDVSDERWTIAGFYAYMKFQILDEELASD